MFRPLAIALITVLLGTLCSVVHADTLIDSFETASDVANVETYNTQVSQSNVGVTDGSYSLQANFPSANFAKITVPCPADQPWNWSAVGGLAADITNTGDYPVTVTFRVEDEQNLPSSSTSDYRSGHCLIEPHQTDSFILPFIDSEAPAAYGVIDMPYEGLFLAHDMTGVNPFNPANIYDFQIGISGSPYATTLYIDNVRTISAITMIEISDQYGQFTRSTWTGKIAAQSDLTAELTAEQADIASHPAPTTYDAYGGWSTGPKLTSTGWFHTQKAGNQWWLVTPNGDPYFALGMDAVNFGAPTFTQDRGEMFLWMPLLTDPTFASFYSTATGIDLGPITNGTTYDYEGTNLLRKYGSNYSADAASMAISRLKSWGFTSIGDSSNSAVYRQGVPVQIRIDVPGTYDVVPNGTTNGNYIPDPWDPNFTTALASAISSAVATEKNDPYLVGYYIGNEMSWAGDGSYAQYALGLGALGLNSAASPAKQQFLTQLQTEYSTIAAFNTAWGTSFASWAAMGSPLTFSSLTSQAETDINAFTLALSQAYFKLVAQQLKQQDPNHLYLGCRFASTVYTAQELQACAQYADVVSMNIYTPGLNTIQWNSIAALNAPFMDGEFSFGSIDAGVFGPGIVTAVNQADRATQFENYVSAALSNPCVVGCNWFEYYDQPITGRVEDGQNANYGFVAITDTPYPDMVAASRTVAQNLYAERSNATALSVATVIAGTLSTASLSAVLTQVSSGATLAGKTVVFDIGGTVVGSATTNSSGIATVAFTVPATSIVGPNLINASFAGDSSDSACSAMGVLNVSAIPTSLTMTPASGSHGAKTTIAVTLVRSDTGAPLAGYKITISLKGTALGTFVTNSNGVASLLYSIPWHSTPGVVALSASFAGNITYATSTSAGSLTIVPAPTKIVVTPATGSPGQAIVLNATLTRTDLNEALYNYTVTFSVGGIAIGTATTHSTGIAYCSYRVPSGSNAGTVPITVTFAGDTQDTASSGSGTLTIP